MAFLRFTDALMEAKRRSALQGREVTQQEAAGISEGFAANASTRGIEAEKLKTQKEQFAESLANQKEEFGRTMTQREKEWGSQVEQANKQYELAQAQLAEQIRQFNESSAEQRRQFGEQMAFQIQKSADELKIAKSQLGVTKSTTAMQLIQAGYNVPDALAPEGWNAESYKAKNPDVAASSFYGNQPLRHYYAYGQGEGRTW